MSAHARLLEGTVDNRDAIIEQLDNDKAELAREVSSLRAEIAQIRRANSFGVLAVRKQLAPLYHALQALFGEMDKLNLEAVSVDSSPAVQANNSKWDFWKNRVSRKSAKVIDALLHNADLNTTQLAAATGMNRSTIPQAIYELNKAGLVNKNAGRFSLKQL